MIPFPPLHLESILISVFTGSGTARAKSLNATRFETMKYCLVISVKTIVNFVPLKKSHLETLNQYLHNILNGHSLQFLRLSVQNIEVNTTGRDAIFRLQRDKSLA